MDPHLSVDLRRQPASGEAVAPKLVFRGVGSVKRLLAAAGSKQPPMHRQGGGEQQDVNSPSQGEAGALTDSPGQPFSPSSDEPSPVPPPDGAEACPAGPRSVHGQPPGKQPHPDDRTPEAEAARAQAPPQPAGSGGAADASRGAPVPAGAEARLGPRSVYAQPPGKQPHPDDPAFREATAGGPLLEPEPDGTAEEQQQRGAAHAGGGAASGQAAAADAAVGARSVYGEPPGKNSAQIYQIAASAQVNAHPGDTHPSPPRGGDSLPPAASFRHPQLQPRLQQVAGAAAGAQGHAGSPSGSSLQARSAPPGDPASRKRPTSQLGVDGGQRKRAANGAGGEGMEQARGAGVPASLARSASFHGGAAAAAQPIRPMPGAPRSLQQRQQLVNGATGGGAAGAPRSLQAGGGGRVRQPPPAATKPKPAAKPPGSGQRRPSSGGGGGAAPAHQYKPGDIVWAKIGVYPWWPAELQRPTMDEHLKPKHASTDLFCVFYGSKDYNWLPPTALKPFTDTHPDYLKHANIKNKALQRAIDEAWVYGMQRRRPDVSWYAGGGGG